MSEYAERDLVRAIIMRETSPGVWEPIVDPGGGGGDVSADAIWDAKGDLAVGSGVDTADNLPVGTDGQVLIADSTQTLGVRWGAAGGDMSTDALWDAKGDLAAGTGANTGAKLSVGANDRILIADSTQATGLRWATPAEVRTAIDVPTTGDAILDALIDAKGDLIVGTADNTPARLPVGTTNDETLLVDSAQTPGVKWGPVPDSPAVKILARMNFK